jgi:RNA polymerase sigma factor (sigma-70 family)
MTEFSSHPLATETALRRRLTALARRWLGQGRDAEDMVQEAFLRTARAGLPSSEAGRQAWLTTVVHHLCIDLLRRQARYDAALAQMDPVPALDEATPELIAQQAQDVEAALSHLVTLLAPQDVALVLLYEIFEMGHAELGALTGRTEAASRQHMHRVLRKLQDESLGATVTPHQRAYRDDETLLSLCRMAIDHRHPAGLIALLQTMRPTALAASSGAPPVHRGESGATATGLVLVQGRLMLAVRLGGVLLCLLPLGREAVCSND